MYLDNFHPTADDDDEWQMTDEQTGDSYRSYVHYPQKMAAPPQNAPQFTFSIISLRKKNFLKKVITYF